VSGHAADAAAAAAVSPVLLVLAGGTVSQAAIYRTAELAAGGQVTVVGVGASAGAGSATVGYGTSAAESEQVRRAVALAMSALEDTGVAALGHVAVTGSPSRTVARVARSRGARIVVLDGAGLLTAGRLGSAAGRRVSPGAAAGLAAELRRRMYGSGITVVTATERGAAWGHPLSWRRDPQHRTR